MKREHETNPTNRPLAIPLRGRLPFSRALFLVTILTLGGCGTKEPITSWDSPRLIEVRKEWRLVTGITTQHTSEYKELLRKHFLLELNGKTGAGVYIWPSVEAAQRAHNEEWRQSVIKRAGSAPTIRYFDLFLLVDNESGKVTEFPQAAEIMAA